MIENKLENSLELINTGKDFLNKTPVAQGTKINSS